MNEVIKDRDEQIAALMEESDGFRWELERLKEVIFSKTVKAIDEYYFHPRGNLVESAERLARWKILNEVIEAGNLTAEYNDWRKANEKSL
jgi:hypothetical protein